MFNVSALLLDDALKLATPLIAPLVSGRKRKMENTRAT